MRRWWRVSAGSKFVSFRIRSDFDCGGRTRLSHAGGKFVTELSVDRAHRPKKRWRGFWVVRWLYGDALRDIDLLRVGFEDF